MNDFLQISPTRWIGLTGFALAALACWQASRRRPSPWRALAAMQALFFVEIVLGLRQRVHDAADALLLARNWYAQREAWQVGLIGLLAVVAIAVSAVIAGGAHRRGVALTLALSATMLTAALFLLEVVSLHAIDALMYTRVAGVLSIAILWALLSLTVALCALIDLRG